MCVCVSHAHMATKSNKRTRAHTHVHTTHTRTQQASAYKFCNPLTMPAISGSPSRSHNSTGGCEKGASLAAAADAAWRCHCLVCLCLIIA